VSVLITVFADWSAVLSGWSIALSSSVSIVIGIAFGLWPAVQASKMHPVEALRSE